MKDAADYWKMIDELLADESGRMTDWEVNFVEDMNKKRDRGVSDKQAATIEKVWDKVFG